MNNPIHIIFIVLMGKGRGGGGGVLEYRTICYFLGIVASNVHMLNELKHHLFSW